jgi:hypothetical protein
MSEITRSVANVLKKIYLLIIFFPLLMKGDVATWPNIKKTFDFGLKPFIGDFF